MEIRPFAETDLDAVVHLSLRAWEPVFDSLEASMDAEVYRELHPDWQAGQKESVEAACRDADIHVWIAREDSRVVGFTALRLHADDGLGEIYMIAVDPDHQRRGIATALTNHALDWFVAAGMTVAMVETGGDPGHAPARRAYEAVGFRRLPIARYFKKI